MLFGERQCRLCLLHLRPAGGDLGLLNLDLGIDVLDVGFGSGDLRFRLLKCDAIVPPVDARDQVAGDDALVVGDRHLGDVARHLRRYGELARLDERVIGRLEVARVVPEHIAGDRQHESNGGGDEKCLAMPPQQARVALFSGLAAIFHRRLASPILLAVRQERCSLFAFGCELRGRVVLEGRPLVRQGLRRLDLCALAGDHIGLGPFGYLLYIGAHGKSARLKLMPGRACSPG